MISGKRLAAAIGAALLVAVAVLASVGAEHEGLNGKEDFAQLASGGFGQHVNSSGAMVADPWAAS